MRNKIILFLVLMVILQNCVSAALISDQGTNVREITTGNLLNSGNLTIEIYDEATAGNLVFSQTMNNTIYNGSWNVMINPSIEYGKSYWKNYKINGEDVNFDGNDRLAFQSSAGKINNAAFINFSLINSCPAGSSIRLIYENGSVECEVDDAGTGTTDLTNYALKNQSEIFVENITTLQTGFFGWLGSLVNRITGLFVQNIDAAGNITVGGKITLNGTSVEDWSQVSGSSGSSYNSTYDKYAYNMTQYGNYNYNQTYTSTGTYNSTYAQWAYNMSDGSYNSTYAAYAYNMSDGIGAGSYNSTYATYAYNQSNSIYHYNMSDGSYNATYNTWAYNMTTTLTGNYNSSYDNGIKWQYNQTYSGSIYNVSYDGLIKWDYNQSQFIIDTYGKYFYNMTDGIGAGSYNLTYDKFAYNMSDNFNYNQTYLGSTFNSTYDKYAYNMTDGSYNSTYATWAYNQSQNIAGVYNSTYDNKNTSEWIASGNDIYNRNSRYVGIGLSNPQAMLSLVGVPFETLNIDKTGTSYGRLKMFVGDGSLGTLADENYISSLNTGLHFWNGAGGSIETMTILNGGNVGIGTTSPSTKLEVNGNTLIGNYSIVGTTTPTTLSLGGSYGTNAVGNSGNQKLKIWDSTGTNTYGIGLSADLMEYQSATGAGHAFFVNGGTEAMRILSGGNVGIGTTDPKAKLEVNTSVATNTLNDGLVLDGDSVGSSTPSYYGAIRFSGNDYDWGAIRTIQTNPSISWLNRMAFSTMNGNGGTLVERMAIDNAGNVGIGTTNPTTPLWVSDGNAGFITGHNPTIVLGSSDGYAAGTIKAVENTIGNSDLSFGVYDKADALYIQHGGNVGIGTTDPKALLEVSGGENGIATQVTNALDNTGFHIKNTGTGGVDWSLQSTGASSGYGQGTLSFVSGAGAGTTNVMTLKAGNVGIGTTNPQEKLEVAGAMDATYPNLIGQLHVRSTDAYAIDKGGVISFGGIYDNNGVSTNWATIYGRKENTNNANAAGYLGFLTRGDADTGTEKMRITSTGNVGIGTSAPENKMEVMGNITRIVQGYGSAAVPKEDGGFYSRFTDISTPDSAGMYFTNSFLDDANQWLGFKTAISGVTDYRMYIGKNGNVGIGTTAPSTKLDVNGTVNAVNYSGNGTTLVNDKSKFWYNMSDGGADGSYNSSYVPYAGANQNVNLGYNNLTVGTNLYVNINKGTVGVNGISTSALLGVGTTSQTNTNLPYSLLLGGNSTNIGNLSGSYWYSAEQQSNAGNLLRFQTTSYRRVNGTSWAGTATRLQYAVDNSFSDGSKAYVEIGAGDPVTSGGGFLALGTAGADRLVIDNSGNVGIGTTTPQQQLHITGNFVLGKASNLLWRTAEIASIDEAGSYKGSLAFYTHPAAASAGTPTEKMRITSTGNVGIGTTLPTSKLHIYNGSITLGSDDGAGTPTADRGGTLFFKNYFSSGTDSRNTASIFSGWTTAGSAADAYLAFSTETSDALAERMRITSTGNVGIGTKNPTQSLVINKTTSLLQGGATIKLNREGEIYGSSIYTGWDSSHEKLVFGVGHGADPANAGQERMVIDDIGNVGIGTTDPHAALQIGTLYGGGTGYATNGGKILLGTSNAINGPEAVNGIEFESNLQSTGYGTKLYTNNAGDYWGIATRYGSASWTERLVVKEQTGNVGIGTTSPNQTLSVNGNIQLVVNPGALVACGIASNGSISSNVTGLYFCKVNSIWAKMA